MNSKALIAGLSRGASRLAARLPADWRSSARRRRILFLILCLPGFVGVVALPVHQNLWVLLLSLVLLAAAVAFRRLSEKTFLALAGLPRTGDIDA